MTQVVTTSQVAAMCGVTVRTVHRWVDAGRLRPMHQLPGETGAYLFDPAEIERLLVDQRPRIESRLTRLAAARDAIERVAS